MFVKKRCATQLEGLKDRLIQKNCLCSSSSRDTEIERLNFTLLKEMKVTKLELILTHFH